jgi:hypothetical protein
VVSRRYPLENKEADLKANPKLEMLGRLKTTQCVFVLGLEALSLWRDGNRFSLARQSVITIYNFQRKVSEELEISDIQDLLAKDSIRKSAETEFAKMILRNLFISSFEIIKKYCEETEQKVMMEGQSWYNFGYHVRNCIGHDWKFDFKRTSSRRFPAKWRGKEIIRQWGEPGKERAWDLRFFGFDDAWQMVKEMELFANILL